MKSVCGETFNAANFYYSRQSSIAMMQTGSRMMETYQNLQVFVNSFIQHSKYGGYTERVNRTQTLRCFPGSLVLV